MNRDDDSIQQRESYQKYNYVSHNEEDEDDDAVNNGEEHTHLSHTVNLI